MIEKEKLDELNDVLLSMQRNGRAESTYVAEWLYKGLLEDLEPEHDLLFLTTSLEEITNTANWLKERIESMMTYSEQFPEFQHIDTGGNVKVAFLDFLNQENEPFALGISSDCVVLYKASSDEVLESGGSLALEVWAEDTKASVRARLSESSVPINPNRVLRCFELYSEREDIPF